MSEKAINSHQFDGCSEKFKCSLNYSSVHTVPTLTVPAGLIEPPSSAVIENVPAVADAVRNPKVLNCAFAVVFVAPVKIRVFPEEVDDTVACVLVPDWLDKILAAPVIADGACEGFISILSVGIEPADSVYNPEHLQDQLSAVAGRDHETNGNRGAGSQCNCARYAANIPHAQ